MSNSNDSGFQNMRRFALVTIISFAVVACLLLGFQDSIKTVSGGLVLALPAVAIFGFMTFYNITHTGDLKFYAVRASIVLDVLLVIFLAIMLKHVDQEAKLHQAATGLLLHLPRSGLA